MISYAADFISFVCGLSFLPIFRSLTIRIITSLSLVWATANLHAVMLLAGLRTRTTGKIVASDLEMIECYDRLIPKLEWYIFSRTTQLYQKELAVLTSARGMGRIIALTILFEVDSINRFSSVQEFASYCRVVKCTHESAGKKYGTGGAKIGNPYLKYAFSEAVYCMARHNPRIRAYLQKRERKHGQGKGKIILAHKIARAVYYMLKRGTVTELSI